MITEWEMLGVGIRHSVEVAAESLYEAAALAVQEFRRHPWSDGIEPGTMTKLEVNIKSPMTTHEVNIRQLENWVSGSAKGLRDILMEEASARSARWQGRF